VIESFQGNLMRQVILYPGEDGFWVAECPGLPGCISQGETKETAVKNIRETIEGYVLALEEKGIAVPRDRFEAVLLTA
jgi:predicted RNase H-like HicB family nuclease